jgi:hypothetical protein
MTLAPGVKFVTKFLTWGHCYKTFCPQIMNFHTMLQCLLDYAGKALPRTNCRAYFENL